MNILGSYINGNYTVTIHDDGTKIKETEADEFIADFPESMDVKITNSCDRMCAYCHEASTPDGKHGDILSPKFIDTLRPWTEMAIGGGNPLSHPDIIPFLEKLRSKNIIANMTVNEVHFIKDIELIKKLIDEKLIHGLGVSYTGKIKTPEFLAAVKSFPNLVLHIINGLMSIEDLKFIANNNLKVLILGYKDFRKGKTYHNVEVDAGMKKMYKILPFIIKMGLFKVVSFDNLAIEQLDVKRILSTEQWNEFFQGGDGTHTMYMNLVNQEFTVSSTRSTRWPIMDTIDEMFNIVKNNSYVD